MWLQKANLLQSVSRSAGRKTGWAVRSSQNVYNYTCWFAHTYVRRCSDTGCVYGIARHRPKTACFDTHWPMNYLFFAKALAGTGMWERTPLPGRWYGTLFRHHVLWGWTKCSTYISDSFLFINRLRLYNRGVVFITNFNSKCLIQLKFWYSK